MNPPRFSVLRHEGRPSPWSVSIPAGLSPDGKRHRKFFRRRAEADAYARALSREWEQADARKWLLGKLPVGVTLVDCVEHWLQTHPSQFSQTKFRDAFAIWHSEREHTRSEKTVQEIRMAATRFLPLFGDQLVAAITPRMLDDAFRGMSWHNRRKYKRVLSTFFTWAARPSRRYCRENPAAELDLGDAPEREIETLTVDECAALMVAAADVDLVPFFALAMFAGIRPSECLLVEWRDIDWQERHVTVKHTKTRRTSRHRLVELSENALAWLEPFRASGLVTDPKAFRRRHTDARTAAGIDHWPADVLRHTFASAHLAHHRDLDRLMLAMGHTSSRMLFEHYHRAMRPSDAQRFWKLMPAPERSNVVRLGNV